MALALYRKYRPRTFAEVIGQEQVTEPLIQALRTGRLNHAYLFSGPRGCGKTSSARILARSLNCEQGPTPEPCGACDSCRALAPDGAGSIDVIEIDAASHGGVDDARELREKAFFAPVSSRFKVYVIDEAHMVSTQGFNALLKLVEEPPEYVKFVFATTEPEKVLGTIKSRTHHYPFRLIPPGVLRPFLEKLCREEGVEVEPAVFPLVVRAGGGSARDSLSVLDQLIAGADANGVTYARAVGLLGVTDVGLIDEMADALAAGDGAAAFATIERVADAGHDPRRYASDLLERFRDLIILQKVPNAVAAGIIDAPADQLDRMNTQASRMGPATLSRLAEIAHNGLTDMRGTTAPRLLLELIVARMLLPGAEDSEAALLQRLERVERRLGAASSGDEGMVRMPTSAAMPDSAQRSQVQPGGGPAASRPAVPDRQHLAVPDRQHLARPEPDRAAARTIAAPAERPVAQSPEPAPEPPREPEPAGGLDAAAVRRVWDEILTMVRRRSQRASALIREAVVRDVQGDEIVLVFRYVAHVDMFPAQIELLAEAVQEVLGGDWRFRAELGGGDDAVRRRLSSSGARGGSSSGGAGSGGAGSGSPGSGGAGFGGTGSGGAGSAGAGSAGAGSAGFNSAGFSSAGSRSAGQRSAAPGRQVAHRSSSAAELAPRAGGTPAPQPSDAQNDEDWPAPVKPGGNRAGGSQPEYAQDEGTRDGGRRAAANQVGRAQPNDGASGAARPSGATGGRAGSGSDGGGRAVAGSASDSWPGPGSASAGRPGPGSASGGRPGLGSAGGGWGQAAARASDGAPPVAVGYGAGDDEPPWDQDYATTYEGFDPGDEPLDDSVDPSRARQTSEEQAIELLAEHLGAERITEA
jgi:DNA polymerase-3 subunit gamma/tau